MSIEADLKKEGIEVIKQLDTLAVNTIAKAVSDKLVTAFPEQNLNYNEIFSKLSKLDMYVAKIDSKLSLAKYFYKNRSIYFNDTIDLLNIDIYAVHECIHYLQELRDSENNLIQLGLCDFTSSNYNGMALNEAAVQLMSSKALNINADTVKYYDITFSTHSPSYYALECNLINQMAYVTGDYFLYNSTIYSNNNFINKFTSLTNKKAYFMIEQNIDKLLELEDSLTIETNKLENLDKKVKKIVKKKEILRQKIQNLFLKTQDLILTSYFDTNFNNINSLEQIEEYRKKLYNYKNVIGTTENYTFFNEYYVDKMAELEARYTYLENQSFEKLSLIPVKHNFIFRLFMKLKKILFGSKNYQHIEN